MRIGLLTSGGDAPGMNAAIRTVVVAGVARGHEVFGVRRGYEGLLGGDVRQLDLADVDGISRFGGTLLGSARSARFMTPEGHQAACSRIADLGLDGLIVIGGNGSLTGAHALARSSPCRVVGLPASIDNDIGHCGLAIGVDTAVNTIVEACDRISDTARAHHRAFLVDVMGRHCGFLALRAGIAAEADAILYGEDQRDEDAVVRRLESVLCQVFGRSSGPDRNAPPSVPSGKTRALIVKAEGVGLSTNTLVKRLQDFLDREIPGVDIRATVLGHVVRGGGPTALDRVIAQRLGYAAVMAIEADASDVMASWDDPLDGGRRTEDPHVRLVPLETVLAETARILDGSSEVVRSWVSLLTQVEGMMAL